VGAGLAAGDEEAEAVTLRVEGVLVYSLIHSLIEGSESTLSLNSHLGPHTSS
jgi:hypothetical protein